MPAAFTDILWGELELREPVLVELVASGPVQRLRGIHQAGASFYLLPNRHPTTRFEHSLGVWHVLARLGGSVDQQVAGLLHDVPHTAFSHTVDIVFPSDEHNFHERFQHAVVMASDIPAILQRHSLPLYAALEPDRYPLLEQPLPYLCADRLDYSLRDMHSAGYITAGEATDFLGHLLPAADGILVDDAEAAVWYAFEFRRASDTLWSGPLEAGAYWALARAIAWAYRLGAFTDGDLFTDDERAMSRLRGIDDEKVQAYLALLAPGTEFYEVGGKGPYFSTFMKRRFVDPLVLEPGREQARRLSEVSDSYGRLVASLPAGRNITYKLWSDSILPAIVEDAQAPAPVVGRTVES